MHVSHTLGLSQNWGGKNNHYVSKQCVGYCHWVAVHCNMSFLQGGQMLNFSPTMPETRSSDFFPTILSSNFRTSQLIFVSRDFVHHSSSIPILKLDWLIWCCAECRHLGWSGMWSYCAVVLPSPILEDIFSLEGLKNHGIARSRSPDRGQTSQLVSPI